MDRHVLGRRAEWLALLLLLLKGHRPRHRNWRGAGGELDLVVERGREIVFVEVKARTSGLYGGAAAAVDAAKRGHLIRASSAYLSVHELWDRPCRYDVVTVERQPRFPYWRVRHLRDAIRPDLGRRL